MNLHITPKEQLLQELEEINNFLNESLTEQAEEAVGRGNVLSVYMARTSKLLADAKYHLNEAMKSEAVEIIREAATEVKATAKSTNALIDSACRGERYLVDWCERLNRTATHQLSWCITIISKAKEEMKLGRFIS